VPGDFDTAKLKKQSMQTNIEKQAAENRAATQITSPSRVQEILGWYGAESAH